jgi:hypothetical protein
VADIQTRIIAALAALAIIQDEKELADSALTDAENALAQAVADREGLTDPDDIAARTS